MSNSPVPDVEFNVDDLISTPPNYRYVDSDSDNDNDAVVAPVSVDVDQTQTTTMEAGGGDHTSDSVAGVDADDNDNNNNNNNQNQTGVDDIPLPPPSPNNPDTIDFNGVLAEIFTGHIKKLIVNAMNGIMADAKRKMESEAHQNQNGDGDGDGDQDLNDENQIERENVIVISDDEVMEVDPISWCPPSDQHNEASTSNTQPIEQKIKRQKTVEVATQENVSFDLPEEYSVFASLDKLPLPDHLMARLKQVENNNNNIGEDEETKIIDRLRSWTLRCRKRHGGKLDVYYHHPKAKAKEDFRSSNEAVNYILYNLCPHQLDKIVRTFKTPRPKKIPTGRKRGRPVKTRPDAVEEEKDESNGTKRNREEGSSSVNVDLSSICPPIPVAEGEGEGVVYGLSRFSMEEIDELFKG